MELKAFTLVEVLISLLLLGIIGTFAFFIMGNSKTAFNAIHNSSIERDSFLSLTAHLHRDVQDAYSKELDEGYIIFEAPNTSVSYSTEKDSTLRITEGSILRFETSLHILPQASFEDPTLDGALRFQMNTAGKERRVTIRSVEDVLGKILKAKENGH